MGVDVAAIARARPAAPHKRCRGSHYQVYGYKRYLDGRPPGCYVTRVRPMLFRGGTLLGYQNLRETLCRLVLNIELEEVWKQRSLYRRRPFFKFFDACDHGAIGPVTSLKILKDFEKVEARVTQQLLQHESTHWMAEVYDYLTTAFWLASDDGFVIFS